MFTQTSLFLHKSVEGGGERVVDSVLSQAPYLSSQDFFYSGALEQKDPSKTKPKEKGSDYIQ